MIHLLCFIWITKYNALDYFIMKGTMSLLSHIVSLLGLGVSCPLFLNQLVLKETEGLSIKTSAHYIWMLSVPSVYWVSKKELLHSCTLQAELSCMVYLAFLHSVKWLIKTTLIINTAWCSLKWYRLISPAPLGKQNKSKQGHNFWTSPCC